MQSDKNIPLSPSHNVAYQKLLQRIVNLPQKDTHFIVQVKPPRMNIKFNRPKRYNSFTIDMYITLAKLIKEAQEKDQIKFIVLMGEGGNFSSGNDLSNFTNPIVADLGPQEDIIRSLTSIMKSFTQTIITAKKPIIAFAFTMLALLDKVFAVQTSSFIAPLVSSAQGPELCASYTFPKIFGKNITEQIISFGKFVNAQFLQKFRFLQKCQSKQQAQQKIDEYLKTIDELPWQSYRNARRLYKEREEKVLLQVNEREIDNLIERLLDPNLMTYLARHLQKMKKLKQSAKL